MATVCPAAPRWSRGRCLVAPPPPRHLGDLRTRGGQLLRSGPVEGRAKGVRRQQPAVRAAAHIDLVLRHHQTRRFRKQPAESAEAPVRRMRRGAARSFGLECRDRCFPVPGASARFAGAGGFPARWRRPLRQSGKNPFHRPASPARSTPPAPAPGGSRSATASALSR